MRAGGSRWDRLTGAAIDGPHEGRRLEPLGRTMFWFAWLSFNQETSLWDGP
jgi:ammonia channel protein AmtB